uniref:Bcl2 modifying factor n=1 Tax=Fundulus heteroclitus TaxID=8078 RepID=A0A3Q2PJX9_FUNHE
MEDEEDDVFEPDPNCWRTPFREIKCEDRGTQTPGPALAPNNGMLPCGVAEEPRQLFYGNAGFRLHFPAHFELVGDFDARRQEEQNRMEPLPLHQPAALSLEACIGQKLQLIGDQFHREHLQQRGSFRSSLAAGEVGKPMYYTNVYSQCPTCWLANCLSRLAAELLILCEFPTLL